jgi:hypothetical protein
MNASGELARLEGSKSSFSEQPQAIRRYSNRQRSKQERTVVEQRIRHEVQRPKLVREFSHFHRSKPESTHDTN